MSVCVLFLYVCDILLMHGGACVMIVIVYVNWHALCCLSESVCVLCMNVCDVVCMQGGHPVGCVT